MSGKLLVVKSWLIQRISNTQVRRIAGDGSWLLASNGVASGLGLIGVAIVTRALGAEGLGLLVLCQTVIGLAAALLLPKPWQTLIRYGAPYKAHAEIEKLHTLLIWGFLVEGFAALMAYTLVQLALNLWPTTDIGDSSLVHGLSLYSITLLFQIPGVPTTLFRLFRKYRLQATINCANALVLLVLIAGAFYFQLDVNGYILASSIASITGSLLFLAGALHIMHSEGLLMSRRVSLSDLDDSSGIFSFALSMHFSDLMGAIMRQADYLVIASFLGPAGVGTMKILKQFGRPFYLLVDPIKQVAYPEACELYTTGHPLMMVKYVLKVSVLLAIILAITFAALMLTMPFLLGFVFGAQYVSLFNLAASYTIIHVVFLMAQGLSISALAMGKATAVFYSYVIMNIVYILAILLLTPVFDVGGIVLAFSFGTIAWCAWLLEVNRRGLKQSSAEAIDFVVQTSID